MCFLGIDFIRKSEIAETVAASESEYRTRQGPESETQDLTACLSFVWCVAGRQT